MAKKLDFEVWKSKFITKAIKKHGDRFDYSKLEDLSKHEKVTIICKEHGEFQQIPGNHLKGKYPCPECLKAYGSKIVDLTGHVFGNLLVIKIFNTGDKGRITWQCECKCGNITNIIGNNLKSGQESCSCAHKNIGCDSNRWTGLSEISGDFFSSIKRNAISRHINFNITPEYVWNLFISQNRKCNLTGQELNFCRNVKTESRGVASLDRINSSIGYIDGNVQWVHKDINMMKWDFEQNYFIQTCKEIVEYKSIKHNPEKLQYSDNQKRNYNWKGCGEISGSYFYGVLRGAVSRGLELSITIEHIWNLFLQTGGVCSLSGRQLSFQTSRRKSDGTASLDRIDSLKGYIEGNVQWVHKDINTMKNNQNQDSFIEQCIKIFKYTREK